MSNAENHPDRRVSWRSRTRAITIGERVAVSARWLRSTGQHTGDICFCRGTVTAIKDLGQTAIATIAWEPIDGHQPDVPTRMNVANLSKVSTQRGVMDD